MDSGNRFAKKTASVVEIVALVLAIALIGSGVAYGEYMSWTHWDLTSRGLWWNYPAQMATSAALVLGGMVIVGIARALGR